MLVFKERRKPGYPENYLAEQGRDPTTNSSHIWLRRQDSNLGHITLAPPFIFGEIFSEHLLALPSFRRSRMENSYSRPLPSAQQRQGTFLSLSGHLSQLSTVTIPPPSPPCSFSASSCPLSKEEILDSGHLKFL